MLEQLFTAEECIGYKIVQIATHYDGFSLTYIIILNKARKSGKQKFIILPDSCPRYPPVLQGCFDYLVYTTEEIRLALQEREYKNEQKIINKKLKEKGLIYSYKDTKTSRKKYYKKCETL